MATEKRFPREPQSGGYNPTETEINSSGDYQYNVDPINVTLGELTPDSTNSTI
jgi:hypothetical protein